MRASNDFSLSLKMACVIYALLFFRYLQPMVSMLMFLEQHGHFDFPMTRSSSVSLPLPLRHTAKMIRALICLRPSSCLVASKLSACEQVYISTKCHKMFQTRPLAKTNLQPVEQRSFIHVVDIFSLVLVQSLPDVREWFLDVCHVNEPLTPKRRNDLIKCRSSNDTGSHSKTLTLDAQSWSGQDKGMLSLW